MPKSVPADNHYPAAQRHDPIEELFEDVFWVHGSMRFAPGMRINRNMVENSIANQSFAMCFRTLSTFRAV